MMIRARHSWYNQRVYCPGNPGRRAGSPADNPLNRIKILLNAMKGGNILRKGCSDEDCTFMRR